MSHQKITSIEPNGSRTPEPDHHPYRSVPGVAQASRATMRAGRPRTPRGRWGACGWVALVGHPPWCPVVGVGYLQRVPALMQAAILAIVSVELTLAKSLWSEKGLWFSSGNESSWYWPFFWMLRGMS